MWCSAHLPHDDLTAHESIHKPKKSALTCVGKGKAPKKRSPNYGDAKIMKTPENIKNELWQIKTNENLRKHIAIHCGKQKSMKTQENK